MRNLGCIVSRASSVDHEERDSVASVVHDDNDSPTAKRKNRLYQIETNSKSKMHIDSSSGASAIGGRLRWVRGAFGVEGASKYDE